MNERLLRIYLALASIALISGCAFWRAFTERAKEGAHRVAEDPSMETGAKEGVDLLFWLLAGGWAAREAGGVAVKKLKSEETKKKA